jgi:hypothetical protein
MRHSRRNKFCTSKSMTEQQRKAIVEFAVGRGTKQEVCSLLGFDIEREADQVLGLLDDAVESQRASDVECALLIAFKTSFTPDFVPTLAGLLAMPWHHSHEDIVGALQKLKDPRAVEALYEAALASHDYLAYDELFGLARKCTWALADIGTAEALAKLRLLATCDNQRIASYAQKRIDSWEKEKRRKGA